VGCGAVLCVLLLVIVCVVLVLLLYAWLVQWTLKVLAWIDDVTSALIQKCGPKNFTRIWCKACVRCTSALLPASLLAAVT
jgi:hypothetical protein